MAQPVTLNPLLCVHCGTPLPAQPGELVWACTQCQQGQMIFKGEELVPIEINYHSGISAGATGRPYWVANGTVHMNRQTYSGSDLKEAQRFWSTARMFFIPAYNCTLERLVELGPRMLQQPVALQAGPIASFEPVTVVQDDIYGLAEFIVMGIEASRKDKLKELTFQLELGLPALWILPG